MINQLNFNSRLLSETNFYRVWLVQKRCNFNSRLREETNDHLGRRTGRVYGHFNSRLRRETNYDDPELEVLLDTFQLTSPQGDERELPNARYIYTTISIHVSARGRTIQEYCRRIWGVISTHVSARRRT